MKLILSLQLDRNIREPATTYVPFRSQMSTLAMLLSYL